MEQARGDKEDRRPQGAGPGHAGLLASVGTRFHCGARAIEAGLEPRVLWRLISRLDCGDKCGREETRQKTCRSPGARQWGLASSRSPESGRR